MGNCTSCRCRKSQILGMTYYWPSAEATKGETSAAAILTPGKTTKSRSRKQSVASGKSSQKYEKPVPLAVDSDNSSDEDDVFGAERQRRNLLRRKNQDDSSLEQNDNPLSRNSIVIGSVVVVDDNNGTPKGLDNMVESNLSVPLGKEIHPSAQEHASNIEGGEEGDGDGEGDDWTVAAGRVRRRGKSSANSAEVTQQSPQSGLRKGKEGASSAASKGDKNDSNSRKYPSIDENSAEVLPLSLTISASNTDEAGALSRRQRKQEQKLRDQQRSDAASSPDDKGSNSTIFSPISPAALATPANSLASPFLPASGLNASSSILAITITEKGKNGKNKNSDESTSPEAPKSATAEESDTIRGRSNSLAQRMLNWYDSDSDDDEGYAILTPQMRSPTMGTTPTASGSRTPITGSGGAVRLNVPGRFSLNSNQKLGSSHFAASPTNGGGRRLQGGSGRSRTGSITSSPSAGPLAYGRSANAAAAAAGASPTSRGSIGSASPTFRGTSSNSASGGRSRKDSLTGGGQTGISLLSGGDSGEASAKVASGESMTWRARLAGSGVGSPGPSSPGTPVLTPRGSSTALVAPLKMNSNKSSKSNTKVEALSASPKISPSFAARLRPLN